MSVLLILHVAISLIGIVTGFVVAAGFLRRRGFCGWNAVFLATTIATSVSGFLLPADRFLPSHAVGILSLVALAAAVVARYRYQLRGAWRPVYIVTALVSQYFNVFVLVVQMFQKIPILRALAPTQTEPAFAVAHLVVFAAFVVLGRLSLQRAGRLPIADKSPVLP